MDTSTIKAKMKANKITYQQLADMTHMPLVTIKSVLSNKTKNPRIDTVQAILGALDIVDSRQRDNLYYNITAQEKQILSMYNNLSPSKQGVIYSLLTDLTMLSSLTDDNKHS